MSAPEVRVELAAIRAMHADAESCPVETGGICVGPDECTIAEYIPSGAAARRTATSFALDPEYLQPKLDAAAKRGLRFVGVHHVHPEGCTTLSSIDERAAASILGDPDWGVRTLLLPLTVRIAGGVRTRVFVAGGSGSAIAEGRLVVGSTFAPACATEDRAADCDHEPLLGPARLARELDALRARRYEVRVERLGGRGTDIRLARGPTALAFVVPPEFPLSPPDVFLERGGRRVRLAPSSLESVLGWSSLRTLAEIADEAAGAPTATMLSHARIRFQRMLERAALSLGSESQAW